MLLHLHLFTDTTGIILCVFVIICWLYYLLIVVECFHLIVHVVLLTNLGSKLEPQIVSPVIYRCLLIYYILMYLSLFLFIHCSVGMDKCGPFMESIQIEFPAFLAIICLFQEFISFPLIFHRLIPTYRITLFLLLRGFALMFKLRQVICWFHISSLWPLKFR